MPTKKLLANLLLSFTLLILLACESIAAPLVISHSPNMYPISYLNQQGSPDGILINIWKQWANETGTEIEFRLYDWKDSIQAVINGEAHVHGGLLYSEDREKNLSYGYPIIELKCGLFLPVDNTEPHDLNSPNITCGVIHKSYSSEYMIKHYPFTKLAVFKSSKEMCNALEEHRINAFVSCIPAARHMLETHGLKKKFKCVDTVFSEPIYAAVRIDNSAILDSIPDGFAKISLSPEARELATPQLKYRINKPWHQIVAIAILAFLSPFLLCKIKVLIRTIYNCKYK